MSRSSHPVDAHDSSAPDRSDDAVRTTRRTEGVRVQGRSARVVELVLTAVAEELGQVGYENLRVESVAVRSGVNKTTIYRRWPTKSELVTATLEYLKDEHAVPDTGSLREDILALTRGMVARVETPIGRGVVRMVQAERAHPEVADMMRGLRQRHLHNRQLLFERAVQRGEIPAGSNTHVLAELMMAPLIARLVHVVVPVDDEFLQILADTIVTGARAGTAVRT